MSGPEPTWTKPVAHDEPSPPAGRRTFSLSLPDFKTPSGTIWNDLATAIIAIVALLKALGVIG